MLFGDPSSVHVMQPQSTSFLCNGQISSQIPQEFDDMVHADLKKDVPKPKTVPTKI